MLALKRNVAVIVLAGLVLGGGGVAWAAGGPARPTLVAAQTGDATTPPRAPALTQAERQARRAEVKACVEAAGEDVAARRACLAAAGLKRPGKHGGAGGAKRGPGPMAIGALGKAVHGTVIVPGEGGTWQTVTFDRGSVNADTDTSRIVLDRPDGVKVTMALTADTRYRGMAGAAAIQDGKPALVVSKNGKATLVVQRDPAHAKPPAGGNNGDAPVVPND